MDSLTSRIVDVDTRTRSSLGPCRLAAGLPMQMLQKIASGQMTQEEDADDVFVLESGILAHGSESSTAMAPAAPRCPAANHPPGTTAISGSAWQTACAASAG